MNIYLSKILHPDKCNAAAISRKIEMAKEGDTLIWKDGIYPVSKSIIQNKKVHWEKSNTTLQATTETTLLTIAGRAHDSEIGRITFKGLYTVGDVPKSTLPGILVSAVVLFTPNVVVRNVSGNGITVSADSESFGTNASHSKFDSPKLIECGGHGMYFHGGDANQCGINHGDARDCGGFGFWDNSFLGNKFDTCMTHNNKGGSYKAGNHDNPNPRTGFYGCYAEGDQLPVDLGGVACWFGGLPSRGIIVTQYAKVFTYDTVEIFKK